MSPKSAQEMWIDGDEFSVRKNGVPLAGQSQSSAPATRYAPQQPPVPASFAAAGTKLGSASTAKRCAVHPQGLTNMEFIAYVHSQRPIAT